LKDVPAEHKGLIAGFVETLFQLYADCHFTFLEINPLVIVDNKVHILDLAAKLDSGAEYLCRDYGAIGSFLPHLAGF
jgi:ATP citrate (pro-S)-lyase